LHQPHVTAALAPAADTALSRHATCITPRGAVRYGMLALDFVVAEIAASKLVETRITGRDQSCVTEAPPCTRRALRMASSSQ